MTVSYICYNGWDFTVADRIWQNWSMIFFFIPAAEIVASAMIEQELSPLIASSVTASSHPAPVTVVSALGGSTVPRPTPVPTTVTSVDLSATSGSVAPSSFSELLPVVATSGQPASSSLTTSQVQQSSVSTHPTLVTPQVVGTLPPAISSNISSVPSFQQSQIMTVAPPSIVTASSTSHLLADIHSLTNAPLPAPSFPPFTSPFPNLFHNLPSQPPTATSTPLQPPDNPASSMLVEGPGIGSWATSIQTSARDNHQSLTNQNSTISQLLDSYMSDQPSSVGSSTYASFPPVTLTSSLLTPATQPSLLAR